VKGLRGMVTRRKRIAAVFGQNCLLRTDLLRTDLLTACFLFLVIC
jgi:hypothetical protein